MLGRCGAPAGHFLGSLSGLLLQIVIDLNDFGRYLARHRMRIRNHPHLFERKQRLLYGRLLLSTLRCCGGLLVACAGAALGSLLWNQPGNLGGFNLGEWDISTVLRCTAQYSTVPLSRE